MAKLMTWKPEKLIAKTEAKAAVGIAKAARFAAQEMKKKLRGQGSGYLYRHPAGGTYRASAPGEPPAERTGDLMDSVHYIVQSELSVLVGTPLLYGRFLEMGTEKIKQRPWLRSTIIENRRKLMRLIAS